MPHLPLRCAAAAITILAMGAGAAPALAAGNSPLVRTIEKDQPGIDLVLNENLQTATGQRTAIHALVANAYRCDQDTAVVARIPAPADQQAGKAEWLSGVRLAARFDVQEAGAVYTLLSGHTTAGMQQLNALRLENNRVNRLISTAQGMLGIH